MTIFIDGKWRVASALSPVQLQRTMTTLAFKRQADLLSCTAEQYRTLAQELEERAKALGLDVDV